MMRRLVHITLIGFTALMLVFALTRAPDANASIGYQSPYTFEQTFGSALRMLRVDLGYRVLERDKDLGYILFSYTSPQSDSDTTVTTEIRGHVFLMGLNRPAKRRCGRPRGSPRPGRAARPQPSRGARMAW